MLPSGPTLRHALVIGVDGVRFDLPGRDSTPSIWAFGQAGFLAPVTIDEATPTSSPGTLVTARSGLRPWTGPLRRASLIGKPGR